MSFKVADYDELLVRWEEKGADVTELQLTEEDRLSLVSEQVLRAIKMCHGIPMSADMVIINLKGNEVPVITTHGDQSTCTVERPFLPNRPWREMYPIDWPVKQIREYVCGHNVPCVEPGPNCPPINTGRC